ncbi:MAG: FAD-dependent oxidoreductase [Syntrophomonadaceae bacterium]|nr:FAD-dependent oxidoreductase [Syntrophomonadaceae bacterium]
MRHLVVIGGVAAGTSAAAKARRVDAGLKISLFTQEGRVSYGSCGLPYFIAGQIAEERQLIARTVEVFAQQGIEVHLYQRAEEIDPTRRLVRVVDVREGAQREVGYDALVIATGASPVLPPVPGRELAGVFTLRTLDDGLAIRRYLQEQSPQRAVIVGAGYIGLEMVEAFHQRGMSVTVVEMAPQVLPNMDADMAALVQEYLEGREVRVLTAERVLALEPAAGQAADRVGLVRTERHELPAELVLLSAGVRPNAALAARAGVALGAAGAIRVNQRMETNLPNVYAAGDCATTVHLVSGEEVYLPMGTTANKQGRVAGANAAGGEASFPGVVGTGIARILEMEVARTGLCERECKALGIDYRTRTIRSRTVPGYFPGSGRIHVKVLAEHPGGRLLGAQIVGRAGSAKRIDVFATALTLGAAVGRLWDADLAYAPPFSPVFDPVLLALNAFRREA